MTFTADHIRTLAHWAECLGLDAVQASLYGLYHRLTVTRDATAEETNSIAMNAIKILRDTETDKDMFWRTMSAWGL